MEQNDRYSLLKYYPINNVKEKKSQNIDTLTVSTINNIHFLKLHGPCIANYIFCSYIFKLNKVQNVLYRSITYRLR